jgi:hypothetical protein
VNQSAAEAIFLRQINRALAPIKGANRVYKLLLSFNIGPNQSDGGRSVRQRVQLVVGEETASVRARQGPSALQFLLRRIVRKSGQRKPSEPANKKRLTGGWKADHYTQRGAGLGTRD